MNKIILKKRLPSGCAVAERNVIIPILLKSVELKSIRT